MLYNKAALERDLDAIEKTEQQISAQIAHSATMSLEVRRIVSKESKLMYAECEKLKRRAKMRLVESQQIRASFAQLRRLSKHDTLRVNEKGVTYNGEAAFDKMERSLKTQAYWAGRDMESEATDSDSETPEEEVMSPLRWTQVRNNAFGFWEFRDAGGSWLPISQQTKQSLQHIEYKNDWPWRWLRMSPIWAHHAVPVLVMEEVV